MVNLVTVKDRELMKVGTYSLSTGEFECTPELIKAAIQAHDAGVLRKPVVRLGHNDPRFSGDPAVGWFDNLRVSDDGSTLYGDHMGVPKWLADNMPSAYPSLSIEGMYDYTAPDGTGYDFVLTGVGLLGATEPGIGSLKSIQDLEVLYDVAAAAGVGGTPVRLGIQIEAASASEEEKGADVASFKEQMAERLGLKTDADDAEIIKAFEAAQKPAEKAEEDKPVEDDPEVKDDKPVEEPALIAASAADVVSVDKKTWSEVVEAAKEVRNIRAEQATEKRERLVMAAIGDGRIRPASKADWIKHLEVDPGGHNATALATLARGLVPVTEMGHAQVSASGGETSTAESTDDGQVADYASARFHARLGLPFAKGSEN